MPKRIPDDLKNDLTSGVAKTKSELDREKAQQAQEQAAIEESARKTRRTSEQEDNESASEASWSEFQRHADELIKAGRRGYDSFESAMHEILTSCIIMNEAINRSLYSGELSPLTINKIAQVMGSSVTALRENFDESAYTAKTIAPKFQTLFTIENDDENKSRIKLTDFKRDDGKPLSPAQQSTLKTGILLWLNEHGYTINDDETFASRAPEAGATDRATLERLRDDPTNGLNAFFKEHSDLKVEAGVEEAPSFRI